jgi:uncharacterized protein YifN (PemK superfamily)
MAIRHRPKVGEILECDFGQWAEPPSFDGHIKPEMRKRRMVVVLNGNLDGQACAVVPISSSDADDKGFSAKYHVPLPQEHFVVTSHYDIRDRWALADRIAVVSRERLFYIKGVSGKPALKLPPSLVSEIQIAVIGAINAKSLLQTED